MTDFIWPSDNARAESPELERVCDYLECTLDRLEVAEERIRVQNQRLDLTDSYRRKLFECKDALNNLRSEYHNRTAELEGENEDLQNEIQSMRRQPVVSVDVAQVATDVLEAVAEAAKENGALSEKDIREAIPAMVAMLAMANLDESQEQAL